jgi:hypothetical protein
MRTLRRWWQEHTGVEDTPFDGDTPAWLVSLMFNVLLMVGLAMFGFTIDREPLQLSFTEVQEEEEELEPEIVLPQEFVVSELPIDAVGAQSEDAGDITQSLAPTLADIPEIEQPVTEVISAVGDLAITDPVLQSTGLNVSDRIVRGSAGVGTQGAGGAIDIITEKILLSLESRKTLVVWLFDATISLEQQRKEVHDRFDRIYHELGVIESSNDPRFAKHTDKPLLTSVVAFGKEPKPLLKAPTDDLATIKTAVAEMPLDRSGVENTFLAVLRCAEEYTQYALKDRRNVMIIVFTDEKGDDEKTADAAIAACRKFAMPVFVVGVPAPFGRSEAMMKWTDPDPAFDQTPQFGRVDQGPESRLTEVVKIRYPFRRELEDPMDSGFGPYWLTRLCVETGGIYFTVHPNRKLDGPVSREDTANLASHLRYFFDPDVMRPYRPDYVSDDEYRKLLMENKAMQSLVEAARHPETITPMSGSMLRFPRRDEADLQRLLTEAQKEAAKLEPKILHLYNIVRIGEPDRPKLTKPRWQAGYDLAMGRVMAVKVRTEAYNAMLAKAKTMKFQDPKNDTWVLEPADTIEVGSVLEKEAQKARQYLERVVKDHPGTPWAMMAEGELATPLGWTWKETYTGVNATRPGMGNGNAPLPPDEMPKNIPKPPPKRTVPSL